MDDFKLAKIPSSIALVCAVFTAALTLAATQAIAAEAVVELPPDVRSAFDELVKKSLEARLETITAEVEKSAAELAERLNLDAAAKEKLAQQYPKIIAETQTIWAEKFEKSLRPFLETTPDAAENIRQWHAQSLGTNPQYNFGRPDRTTAWNDALAASLSPEQFAKYTADTKAETDKLQAELADYFLRAEEIVIMQMEPLMDTEIEHLKRLTDIDEPRVEILRAGSKTAIRERSEEWRKRWEEQVYDMTDEQRKQVTSNQRGYDLDLLNKDNPKTHQAWKDGLAKALTAAEIASAEQRRAEIRRVRAEAFAMVLIEALDPLIGFSPEQRSQLTPVLGKPLQKMPDYFFDAQAQNNYYSINPGQLFTNASAVAKSEVLPLLEEGQRKRWEAVTPQKLSPNNYSSRRQVTKDDETPAAELDAIGAQRLISSYIYSESKEITRNHLDQMEALVDRILALAELDAEKITNLRTAAKGAARMLAHQDIENFESWARRNFQNVPPADLAARLDSSSKPRFSSSQSAAAPTIWTKTIDRLLSPEQKARWDAEAAADLQWSADTKLAILMSEIDRSILLTPEKRDTLQVLVNTMLKDYETELNNMFSYAWHIQGYYSMAPLSLISEKDLASALDKEQIKRLRERSPDGFEDMIDSLKSERKERLKAEKKATKQ